MAAARALAAARGIDATSVDDIAERAGVAKGTVYYNFGSKEALYTTVLLDGMVLLRQHLEAAVAGKRGAEAVEAAVGEILQRVVAAPDFARLFLSEAWATGRPWHRPLLAARAEVVEIVRRAVEETVADGRLPADRDTALVATSMFAVTLVAGLDNVVGVRRGPGLDAVRSELVALYLR